MDRRSFLKCILGGVLGVLSLEFLPKHRKDKWFSLKLKPEYKEIEGAEEWLRQCEDTLNDNLTSSSIHYIRWGRDKAYLIYPKGMEIKDVI